MKKWTVDDVMTREVITAGAELPYRALVDMLVLHKISAVPVVDEFRHVLGVVSEADLLRKIEYTGDDNPRLFERRHRRADRARATARDAASLMSSPPVTAISGISIAAATRLMHHKQVKRLPVIDPLGQLIGIVSRSDLLKVHLRPDDEIRQDVRDGILRALLLDDSANVDTTVARGAVVLTGNVSRWSTTDIADRLIRQIPGVTEVDDKLTFDFDDRNAHGPGVIYGIA